MLYPPELRARSWAPHGGGGRRSVPESLLERHDLEMPDEKDLVRPHGLGRPERKEVVFLPRDVARAGVDGLDHVVGLEGHQEFLRLGEPFDDQLEGVKVLSIHSLLEAAGCRRWGGRSRHRILRRVARPLVRLALALALAAAAVYGLAAFSRDFWSPDEPDFADAVREMNVRGSWLLPYQNGKPYSEKPILYYWTMAATTPFTGGDVASRCAANPLGRVGGLPRLRRHPSRRVARRPEGGAPGGGDDGGGAARLLAGAVHPDRRLLHGPPLRRVPGPDARRPRPGRRERWVWAFHVLLPLAVLTKGPLAIVLTGLVGPGPVRAVAEPAARPRPEAVSGRARLRRARRPLVLVRDACRRPGVHVRPDREPELEPLLRGVRPHPALVVLPEEHLGRLRPLDFAGSRRPLHPPLVRAPLAPARAEVGADGRTDLLRLPLHVPVQAGEIPPDRLPVRGRPPRSGRGRMGAARRPGPEALPRLPPLRRGALPGGVPCPRAGGGPEGSRVRSSRTPGRPAARDRGRRNVLDPLAPQSRGGPGRPGAGRDPRGRGGGGRSGRLPRARRRQDGPAVLRPRPPSRRRPEGTARLLGKSVPELPDAPTSPAHRPRRDGDGPRRMALVEPRRLRPRRRERFREVERAGARPPPDRRRAADRTGQDPPAEAAVDRDHGRARGDSRRGGVSRPARRPRRRSSSAVASGFRSSSRGSAATSASPPETRGPRGPSGSPGTSWRTASTPPSRSAWR